MIYYDDFRMKRELVFTRKTAEFTDHRLHTHGSLEISIVRSNRTVFRTLRRDYEGNPGDVFIFRPSEPHWILTADAEQPAKWIMVLFTPSIVRAVPEGYRLLAPFYAADLASPLIPAQSEHAGRIVAAAELAVSEEERGETGWQARQHMAFIDVLVASYRYFRSSGSGEQAWTNEGIFRVIEQLLSRHAEEIDSEEMIRLSGLGKTWFYNSFKGVTGLSPNDFVTRLRLQTAFSMLQLPDKSVTCIAFECGFQSLSYFNKAFKKYWGVTPGSLRKRE